MHKKDKTFSKFVELKELIEKESGRKLNVLRSDNHGEYLLNEFKKIYAKEGINEI